VKEETGVLDRVGFERVVCATIELLFQAARYARQDSAVTDARCHLLLPMIGFGAYMSRIGAADVKWAVRCFCYALSRRAHDLRREVRVSLCDFDGMTTDLDAALYPVHVGRGPMEGNLFAVARAAMRTAASKPVCVCNAWDARSLVGNGGVRDETIDGMLVAGAACETLWANSSYTHNVALVPALLDPSRWHITAPPLAASLH
jgi:hypothetical protein